MLIKGGHLRARLAEALDLLDDNGTVTVFRGGWIEASPVRGTGCMLSSAIAAGLAQGKNLHVSIEAAKRFVAEAIRGTA